MRKQKSCENPFEKLSNSYSLKNEFKNKTYRSSITKEKSYNTSIVINNDIIKKNINKQSLVNTNFNNKRVSNLLNLQAKFTLEKSTQNEQFENIIKINKQIDNINPIIDQGSNITNNISLLKTDIKLKNSKINFKNEQSDKKTESKVNKTIKVNNSTIEINNDKLPVNKVNLKSKNTEIQVNKIKTPISTIFLKQDISKPKDQEFFDSTIEKEISLSQEEKVIYGTRELKKYKKLKILGKGGCGIVFLCRNEENMREYAVKQISKKGKSDSSIKDLKKEIEILNKLNEGHDYILELVDHIEDNNDIWLIFELGGKSLRTHLFEIKGEFLNNERIYLIKKGKLYKHLFLNEENFKNFFKKLLEAIKFISDSDIVHCDIKPDNILFKYDNNIEDFSKLIDFSDLKLIDFGSAFYVQSPDNFSTNTPEYMPPEITELLEKKASNKEVYAFLKKLEKFPYVIDIWSLGVLILEIIISCPVWINFKVKTIINGKVLFYFSHSLLVDYSVLKED